MTRGEPLSGDQKLPPCEQCDGTGLVEVWRRDGHPFSACLYGGKWIEIESLMVLCDCPHAEVLAQGHKRAPWNELAKVRDQVFTSAQRVANEVRVEDVVPSF